MPTFPRGLGAMPRLAPAPRFPGGLQSWGQSGRGQARAVNNMGRTWEETYAILDTSRQTVRALLRAINQAMREGTVWDIQHPYYMRRFGLGGGAPLVNGADQTGSNLIIDGATPSINLWLRDGDIIKVPGCAVILDVAGDVNTNGSGQAVIPISPPIFVGQSPADNAAVEINPGSIFFKAIITNVGDFPHIDSSQYIDAGLTITFREQPQ